MLGRSGHVLLLGDVPVDTPIVTIFAVESYVTSASSLSGRPLSTKSLV